MCYIEKGNDNVGAFMFSDKVKFNIKFKLKGLSTKNSLLVLAKMFKWICENSELQDKGY